MGDVWKKRKTVWRLGGKRVPGGTPGAAPSVVLSRSYYATLDGKQVSRATADKQVAREVLAARRNRAARAAAGLADPFAAHADRPLVGHLADYAAHLGDKGDTDDHVRLTAGRVRALLGGYGFDRATDVDAGRAEGWLAGLRRPAPPPVVVPPGQDRFTPSEAAGLLGMSMAGLRAAVKRHGLAAHGSTRARRLPRASVEALVGRINPGVGPQTVNHYVRAARGFFRWMVRSRRLGSNPLDALGLLNAGVDVRRGRRELDEGELTRLLEAARGAAGASAG